MKDYKILLKVASILNITIGVLVLQFKIYSVLLFITGFILFIKSVDEDPPSKIFLYILGFILFPLNIVSATIVFIATDKINYKNINGINAPPTNQDAPTREAKNLDLLLKLGVGMILLSGIMFSTTSWNAIPNYIKIVSLLIFAIIFLGLSYFSEIKIKIKTTTYLYWLLSMGLFLLSLIGSFYFGLINPSLTYLEEYSSICYFFTFLMASILILITFFKFQKKYLLYLFYISSIITIFFFLSSVKLENILILLLISVLLLILNIITPKEKVLYHISKLCTYIMIPFIIKYIENTALYVSITSFFNIISIIYLIYKDNKEALLVKSILIDILILIGIGCLEISTDNSLIIIFLLLTIFNTILKFISDNHYTSKDIHYLFYSFVFLITLVITKNNLNRFLISLVYLFENIIYGIKIKEIENTDLEHFIEPISIILTLFTFNNIDFVSKMFTDSQIIFLGTVIFSIGSFFIKRIKHQSIYKCSLLIGTIIGIFITASNKENINSLLFILSSMYLFILLMNSKEKISKILYAISYVVLLLAIFNSYIIVNVLSLPIIFTSISFILLLLTIMLLIKNSLLQKITAFFIVLPLHNLITSLQSSQTMSLISEATMGLYITFLVVRFFCKTDDLKSALGILGIFLSLRIIFFETDIIVAIYIGIVGLFITILGFYKKELKYFFATGMVIIIANTIYQLKDVWKDIPFWIYLLISGISIITFVTIKQLKNEK